MTVVGVAGTAHQFGPGVESLALFQGGRVAAKSLCAIRLGFSREFTFRGRCSFRLVLRRPVSMSVRSSWLAPEAGVGCARFFQMPNQHLLVGEAIQTVGVPAIAHRFLNRVFGFVSRWPSLFVLFDSASRRSVLPVSWVSVVCPFLLALLIPVLLHASAVSQWSWWGLCALPTSRPPKDRPWHFEQCAAYLPADQEQAVVIFSKVLWRSGVLMVEGCQALFGEAGRCSESNLSSPARTAWEVLICGITKVRYIRAGGFAGAHDHREFVLVAHCGGVVWCGVVLLLCETEVSI